MFKLLFLTLFLTISSVIALKPCQPFGLRIFYGQSIKRSDSTEKLVVYFNTVTPCQRSYLQVIKKSGMLKVQCETQALSLSAATGNYKTYVQKCRTDAINYEETFYYNVFGWNGSSISPIPYDDYITAKLADPSNKSRKMNMVVLADWSMIELNIGKYTPIDQMLLQTEAQQEINGIIILGDIGYDLDSNNCINYEKFLIMLAKVAAGIPIIMLTGNHEYNSQDNWQLYTQSFEIYGLDKQLAVGLSFGSLYLVPFDPYSHLFSTSIGSQDKVAEKLSAILKEAKMNGQFIVPASHYPLACSGTSKNCKNDRQTMKAYWDSMLDNGVSLYFGAHYHTYQRLYPYKKGDIFTTQKSNYTSDGGYLISIVEGVAGNDKDIVESIDKIEAFTAAYTINDTGFGILEVSSDNVRYRHLSTVKGETDRIDISIKGHASSLSRSYLMSQ